MNTAIARMVVLSRWALAPLFLGLIVALLSLVAFFFIELWRFVIHLFSSSDIQIVIKLLSLIDLALIANLIVIIVYSGYENFIEKIDRGAAAGWPEWMTAVSFSGLKQKLFASMMAIAGITLLKALMKLETSVSETQVRWLAVANVIFVVSYVALVIADYLAARGSSEGGH